MAAEQNCIYKSVNMAAGEVFVLPPGAVLISVSDTGAITSSCPDPLPVAELKCYKIRWVLNHDNPDGQKTIMSGFLGPVGVQIPDSNNAWEDSSRDRGPITIENFSIGNQVTSASSISARNLSGLESKISSSSSGGALGSRMYQSGFQETPLVGAESGQWDAPGASGWSDGYDWYELYFKTVEDIAKGVYIEIAGASGNVGNVPRFFPIEIDCDDYPTTSVVTSCDPGPGSV